MLRVGLNKAERREKEKSEMCKYSLVGNFKRRFSLGLNNFRIVRSFLSNSPHTSCRRHPEKVNDTR